MWGVGCGRERPHKDYLFGELTGQSHRVQLEDVQDEYLKTGWLEGEAREDGVIEAFVVSVNGWTVRQVCSSHLRGFVEVLIMGIGLILGIMWLYHRSGDLQSLTERGTILVMSGLRRVRRRCSRRWFTTTLSRAGEMAPLFPC